MDDIYNKISKIYLYIYIALYTDQDKNIVNLA